MPFLRYDPLPQCLQPSPLTPHLLARGHQRGSRRYLSNVKCLDLSRIFLSDADLSGADLRGAQLVNTCVYGAKLDKANLQGAKLTGIEATASSAMPTSFADANLEGADLRDGAFKRVDMTNVTLKGAVADN